MLPHIFQKNSLGVKRSSSGGHLTWLAQKGQYFGVVEAYSLRIVVMENDSEEAGQSPVKKGPVGRDVGE